MFPRPVSHEKRASSMPMMSPKLYYLVDIPPAGPWWKQINTISPSRRLHREAQFLVFTSARYLHFVISETKLAFQTEFYFQRHFTTHPPPWNPQNVVQLSSTPTQSHHPSPTRALQSCSSAQTAVAASTPILWPDPRQSSRQNWLALLPRRDLAL